MGTLAQREPQKPNPTNRPASRFTGWRYMWKPHAKLSGLARLRDVPIFVLVSNSRTRLTHQPPQLVRFLVRLYRSAEARLQCIAQWRAKE